MRAGAEATFIKIEGGGHAIFGPVVQQLVRAFLDGHLSAQDVVVSSEPIVQESPQPRPPAGDRPATMRRNGARPRTARELPNGEWLEPNRSSPNGTQYKTFTSEVLGGKEVSYLI